MRTRAAAAAGLTIVIGTLAGCIAPEVEVTGALGVTVDEEQRPVVVVQACQGAATGVDLSLDREGLADDEEAEKVGTWIADSPVSGGSELVLHAPRRPWAGDSVELAVDRGYVATAVGEGHGAVLSQVAFRGQDLADMEPGTVYVNDADPDVRELLGRSDQDFTADACSHENDR